MRSVNSLNGKYAGRCNSTTYARSLIGSSDARSSPSTSYAGTKQGCSTAGSRADGIRSKNS